MSSWNIEVWESGNTFTADGTIPRPNQNLETKVSSTTQKIKLADGSNGFVQLETKYVKESFNMFFANTTSEFRNKILTYMSNGDKVRITTHTPTEEKFIGRFTDFARVWFVGTADDEYDISVSFEQTE